MKEELIIDTEVKGADKAEKQLEDLAKATNEADEAGEKYEETLGDMAKEAEVFGVSINGLTSGFKNSVGAIRNSVKGLQGFKVALASTGVGLLVVALGSLVAWLKNTQEGMNLLEDALATVGAVIDNITGLFTKLGSAMVSLFKGDFTEALNTAKAGLSGFVEGVEDSIQQTLALNEAVRKLQVTAGNNLVITQANNAEIAKNKRVIEDVTKSTNERIQAAERNKELIAQNAQLAEDQAFQELENERTRVNNAKREQGRTQATIEEQKVLRELEAEVIAQQTEANEKVIEFEVKLNELYKLRREEQALLAEQASITSAETIKAQEEVTTSTFKEEEDRKASIARLDQFSADFNEKEKARQEELRKQKELNAEIEYQMTADLFGALAGLAGQDTAIGKALAITQAIMNTNVAITTALRAPTMAQRVLGVAYATATGLKAVSDIRGEPIPEVTVNETSPFGRGGMIGGDLHSDPSGGTMVLAERGEAIINRRSTSLFKPLLNQINLAGGGVPIMANGGLIPESTGINPFTNIERSLSEQRTVLVLDDLDQAETSNFITKVSTTL